MKRTLLITLVLIACMGLQAQVQQGIVKTLGRPDKAGQRLAGVTIRVREVHNAVVSNGQGGFSVSLPGKKPGEPYVIQSLQKQGYEPAERDVIGRQYAYSSKVPLTLVMVNLQQLEADKQRIENNAYKAAERNYKAQMEKLERLKAESQLTAEQYRTQLQQLQTSFEKFQLLVDDMADHYARTDYDSLDAENRRINILIEAGELEQADSLIRQLFNPVDVLKRHQEAKEQISQRLTLAEEIRQKAQADLQRVLKQQERDAEYLYKLYTIALSHHDNEQARFYIETRAELDTTNVQWQLDAVVFIYNYIADYDKAISFTERALHHAVQQYGEQYVAMCYNNMGTIYDSKGDYALALDYYKKALSLKIDILGESNYEVGNSYYNIGCVYKYQGDYSSAVEYMQKGAQIVLVSLGETEQLARIWNAIGACFSECGDLQKAMSFLSKALAIQEKVLGDKHFEVAMTCQNIGIVYKKQNDYEQALYYYQRAMEIFQEVFVPNHPKIGDLYSTMGSAAIEKGEYDQAIKYLQEALVIYTNLFGQNHPNIAAIYINIATANGRQGNYPASLDYYQKASDILLKYVSPRHPNMGLIYMGMGTSYKAMAHYEKALELLENALDILTSGFGENYPYLNELRENIDDVKRKMEQN